MTITLPDTIIKYYASDSSSTAASGFYSYVKGSDGSYMRTSQPINGGGENTFEIDSSTASNTVYCGQGDSDTYVIRADLDKDITISDSLIGTASDGTDVLNRISFDDDVSITKISHPPLLPNQTVPFQIQITMATGAVITVMSPGNFVYRFRGVDDNAVDTFILRGVDPIANTTDRSATVNNDEVLVLTRSHVEGSDGSAPGGDRTYTVKALGTNVSLEKYDAVAGSWVELAVEDTFSGADVDSGHVRVTATDDGSFTVTYTGNAGATENVNIAMDVRTVYVPPPAITTLDEIDLSEETESYQVETGFGDTDITSGSGNDEIKAGPGDDVIDLSMGGTDEVTYSYVVVDTGHYVSWDGGDLIKGFTPGRDSILFSNRGGMPDADPDELRETFLSDLGTGYYATLGVEHNGGDSYTELTDYTLTGMSIHFLASIYLPDGRNTGGVIKFEFDDAFINTFIDTSTHIFNWAEFKREWLPGDAIDESTLLFNGNPDGQAALQKFLRLEVEAATSPSIWLGTEGDDVITVADGTGGWVIHTKGGTDEVRLGNGAEEFVYILDHDSSGITTSDGSDTISNFTLGADTISFVDSSVVWDDDLEALTGLPGLSDLLGDMDSVSLIYDGTNYTGISFDMGDETLTVNFSAGLNAGMLKTKLGVTDDAELNAALTGDDLPTAAGSVTLTSAGIDYVDDLFGSEDVTGINVSHALPDELL